MLLEHELDGELAGPQVVPQEGGRARIRRHHQGRGVRPGQTHIAESTQLDFTTSERKLINGREVCNVAPHRPYLGPGLTPLWCVRLSCRVCSPHLFSVCVCGWLCVCSVAEFDSEDEMRRVIDRLDDQEFFGQRLRITQVQPQPPSIVWIVKLVHGQSLRH